MKSRQHNRPRYDASYLPATKLAELGYCETRMVLARRIGPRVTKEQQCARDAGSAEHARFDRQVRTQHNRPVPAQDRRCFIATAVYGADDVRTQQLRDWRDSVLDRSTTGRLAIAAYYAFSPWIARLLVWAPELQRPVRAALDLFRQGLTVSSTQGEHHDHDG
ncbi:hypothetical protein IMW82_13645 [Rhodanobacter sp. B2A1Ga4]|uniref:CFI-box-CTERM domain-containing protein n=1 Tax=Rhodanobacter sp. B2A1Ga4 TaxID=2778647 RepID=UPI001B374B50|nr:CFI-box-CTERM domain-containing protein [Rhodanobacter sp. B2A1Ga4]MBQ4855716.1 hypothetical protein [Rhodanobacter sp. B2A1Ga4]